MLMTDEKLLSADPSEWVPVHEASETSCYLAERFPGISSYGRARHDGGLEWKGELNGKVAIFGVTAEQYADIAFPLLTRLLEAFEEQLNREPMTDEKPTISIDPEQLMPGYNRVPGTSLIGLAPIFPGDLVLYDAAQTTVIRMTAAGELYWRDRLIECDRDLVDGLRDLLAGLKRSR